MLFRQRWMHGRGMDRQRMTSGNRAKGCRLFTLNGVKTINWPEVISTDQRVSRRTLHRLTPCSGRSRRQGTLWRCMIWAGCVRTGLDETQTRMWRRNGMPKRCRLSIGQKRKQRNGNAPTCNTASGRCMLPDLAPDRTMVRRQAGCPRRQRQGISMRSIPLRAYTTGGRVWRRMTRRHSGFTAAPQSRATHTQILNWQRCTVTGSAHPRIAARRESVFRMHLPAFCIWRKRAAMTSCSTAWGRCCTQGREPKGMMLPLRLIGSGRQSWGTSMRSMPWESCGWKAGAAIRCRLSAGSQRRRMQETPPPNIPSESSACPGRWWKRTLQGRWSCSPYRQDREMIMRHIVWGGCT